MCNRSIRKEDIEKMFNPTCDIGWGNPAICEKNCPPYMCRKRYKGEVSELS